MTYEEFKSTCIAIKQGYDNIRIGYGVYNNTDAKLKMGYYLSICPQEYCDQLVKEREVN